MSPDELRRLSANTPVADPRRYALRWAAHEIDKLKHEIEVLLDRMTKGGKDE
jgi:hypothetical protein